MLRQIRLVGMLLLPSLLSGTVCAAAAIGFLLLINWPFVAHNAFVYGYFFGRHGVVTALKSMSLDPASLWHTMFTHSAARNALSYLFVLSITLVLYTMLERGGHAFISVLDTLDDMQTAQRGHFRLLTRELWVRVAIRAVTAVAWTFYSLIFMWVILPTCISHTRFGIATIGNVQHMPDLLLSVLGLFVGLHIFVIFARLFVFRPRLFGGFEVLMSVEHGHAR